MHKFRIHHRATLAANRKGNSLGLLLVSLVIGTMVGLLVLASLKQREAPPTVQAETSTDANHESMRSDGANSPASVNNPGTRAAQVPQSKYDQSGHDHAGHDHAGHDHASHAAPAGAQVPFVQQTTPNVFSAKDGLSNQGAVKPDAQSSMLQMEAAKAQAAMQVAQGATSIYSDISLRLPAGTQVLKKGSEFQLQIVMEKVGSPLSSTTMELIWNPAHLRIDHVEGMKGGFAAPAQVDLSTPGRATWVASDAQASMTGDVVIALVRGVPLEGSPASTRIFVMPRNISSKGANDAVRTEAGMNKSVTFTVE